jgi:hypothetical protein
LSGTECAWQRPPTFYVWKTRGYQCSFRLLMMGGVLPKTCWALYKYEIIQFWYIVASCWIFLCENVQSIKPPSGHFSLYGGTFNVCVHYGITYWLHQ